jgi:hypothetical protein
VSDQTAILGPITFRHIGYAVAGILEVAVFLAVLRSPTRRTLTLGLAAAVLVAFMFLTTMHERYAFGALVFLALLVAERRMLVLWVVFGIAFTLNLVAAIPATPELGALVPVNGPVGVAGSLVLCGVTIAVLWELLRRRPSAGEAPEAADEGGPIPVQVVG